MTSICEFSDSCSFLLATADGEAIAMASTYVSIASVRKARLTLISSLLRAAGGETPPRRLVKAAYSEAAAAVDG